MPTFAAFAPQFLALFVAFSVLFSLTRFLDWFLVNASPDSVLPVECGFDAGANTADSSRIISALVLVAIFELEFWVIAMSLSTLTVGSVVLLLLTAFALIEITLLGK